MYFKKLDAFRKKYQPHTYAGFRILIGLLFASHGAQKLFGVFGGNAVEPFGLIWFAGIIELFGGILIAVGFLTVIAAGISALTMLVAYIMGHASNAILPIANGGELAILYLLAFLLIKAHGPGKFSVDNAK